MTTAGRSPFSIRAMRAASVGSGAGVFDDCCAGEKALERLLAESLGESRYELQRPTARNANMTVSRIRAFVVVDLVGVDFMGDLMGGNRTTFECEGIRLVGYGTEKKRAVYVLVTCRRNR
jgi:hypothetical protein